MLRKGRGPLVWNHPPQGGERNHAAKLTDDEVAEVRRLLIRGDLTQTAIAKRFGVTTSLVSLIKKGHRAA
jgi:predicted XRE-type DNA-binding protein